MVLTVDASMLLASENHFVDVVSAACQAYIKLHYEQCFLSFNYVPR